MQASLIYAYLRDIKSRLADEAPGMDFVQLCRRMSIVDGPAEFLFPRNVGLMFFTEHPERFFPSTQIDVVHFPDGPGGSAFSEQIFRGPLNRMIGDALRHLHSTVIREHVVKRGDRAEADRFFNYPFAALEEALVNAVYHRSYEEREPIEVRILPDHITITSYPGADRSISLDDLAAGRVVSRRYRNRRIGDFLKELELTEGRGTGIPKIRRAMQSNGSPPAEFKTDEDRTYFTVALPIHPAALQVNTQVSTQVSTQVKELLNARTRALLEFCLMAQNREAIHERLGMKSAKNLRVRYLQPLIVAGLLEMTDPEHPKAPTQKYRTTALGRAALADEA